MDRKKKITITLLLVVLLLLIGGGVWAFRGRGPDPQVKKIREMREELFGEGKQPTREQIDRFHEEMRALTPEQRRQLHEPMRQQAMQRMNKMIDGYFELPPEQRDAYLDNFIEEGERHRKEWEKRRQEMERSRPADGQSPGRGGPPGQAGPGRQSPDSAGRPGGRRGIRTPEQRVQRRNAWLDRIPPERRAKWSAFRDAVRKRRIELGLPAHPPHGRRHR